MIFFGKIGLIYQNTTIIINQDQYYISATEYLEDITFEKIETEFKKLGDKPTIKNILNKTDSNIEQQILESDNMLKSANELYEIN